MKLFYPVFVFLLLSKGLFSQTSITLLADRDNTIYSESTNSNGSGSSFFAGANQSLNKRRGLLHFDLSGIPTDAIIASATLRLNTVQVAAAAVGQSVKVNKVTASWGEGTSSGSGQGAVAATNDATWLVRFTGTPGNWGIAGGDFVNTVSGSQVVSAPGVVSLSGIGIDSDVQSWINNPSTNFGWIVTGNESSPQSVISYATKENGNASQRPSLIITYTTLPITLQSFTAKLSNDEIVLNWQTSTEINNRYFGIEHSTTGYSFAEISRVAGAGNSVLPKNYNFTHSGAGGGRHFYRLAQHDFNGAIHYSQVVMVDVNSKVEKLQIAPNPVESVLNVKTSRVFTQNLYLITNSMGQLVASGLLNGQQINVSKLSKGHYTITIKMTDGVALKAPFVKE